MNLNRSHYYTILILLAGIAVHLPQLLNTTLALDGDECVFAVMVKHIIAGKDISLYFYGQSYAFTLIESLLCVPLSLIAGVSTFSIKASMLIMWLTGVIFFYKALVAVNRTSAFIPLLLALLLVVNPAWAVWAMKARGGYMTAFLCSSVVLYLLFDDKFRERSWPLWLTGVLLVIVKEAQPLWLLVMIPVVLYRLVQIKEAKKIWTLLIPAVILGLGFYLYRRTIYQYNPFYEQDPVKIFGNISRIPKFVYHYFSGRYYFSDVYPDNFFTAASAYLFPALVVVLTGAGIYALVKRGPKDWLFISSVAGMNMLIASSIFCIGMHPRYMLPLAGALLFSIQLWLNRTGRNHLKWIRFIGISMVIICSVGTMTFMNFQPGRLTRPVLQEITSKLEQNDVHYVFVTWSVLDFQLIFYSDEHIVARNKFPPGRYPEYFSKVDSVFYRNKKVAVVGPQGDFDGMTLDLTYSTPDYYIAIDPDREVVIEKYYR